jgi:hypothetical protein
MIEVFLLLAAMFIIVSTVLGLAFGLVWAYDWLKES